MGTAKLNAAAAVNEKEESPIALGSMLQARDAVGVRRWWNPNVLLALQQDAVGLLTGQSTVDGILTAMDAAWKQGPS